MPFKKPYWTNLSLLACLIITTFMVFLQLFGNDAFWSFKSFLYFINYYARIPDYENIYRIWYFVIVIMLFGIYVLANKITR